MSPADLILATHRKLCKPWVVPTLWTIVVLVKALQIVQWLTF